MRPGLSLSLAIGALLMANPGQADPFVPPSDAAIVQRLPYRVDAGERERRAALARDPRGLPLALDAARTALARAREHGDPHELGLAQAALAPWWSQADAPPALRLLRASILQSQHHVDAAEAELKSLSCAATATPAEQAQAQISLAAVLQLRGRFAPAKQACESARSFRPAAITAEVCLAELRSLRGQAEQAWQDLTLLSQRAPRDPWLALVRAELAERLGAEHAERAAPGLYAQALASAGEVYTRAAYADWMLARGRARDALSLIEHSADAEADALLLRRAIALRQVADPRAAAVAAVMRERLSSAERRGPGLHAREQARFALDVEQRPQEALRFAKTNWAMQREPADAVLLLRSARAADDASTEAELRQWLRQQGWQDARLDPKAPA